MKRIFPLLCLIGCLAVADWSDPKAAFRVQVRSDRPGQVCFVPLGSFAWPANLENGVSVYSAAGEAVPFFLYSESWELLVAAKSELEAFDVYFGFEEKQASDRWPETELGPPPSRWPLEVQVVHAALKSKTAEQRQQWFQQRREAFDAKHPVPTDDKVRFFREALAEAEARLAAGPGAENPYLEKPEARAQRIRRELKQEEKRLTNQQRGYERALAAFLIRQEKDEKRLEGEVERLFGQKRKVQGVGEASEVGLKVNPFGGRNRFAARFRGGLVIREEGVYEFAINSIEGSSLSLDGQRLLAWTDLHDKSDGWQKTCQIRLEPGLHPLAFYYQKNHGQVFASAAWKKPGQETFEVLTKEDFAPGWPVVLGECRDRQASRYPLVAVQSAGKFLLGENTASWFACALEPGTDQNAVSWLLDGQEVYRGQTFSFAVDQESSAEVKLRSDSGAFPDFRLHLPQVPGLGQDPDIFLKTWAPSYIYDDETLGMTVEVSSDLSDEVLLPLTRTLHRDGALTETEVEWIAMPAKRAERFQAASQAKRHLSLRGSELKAGAILSFSLGIPPLSIACESLRFLPVAACAQVADSVNGLLDADGNRVVPVLHRRTLAEKRTWSLPKNVLDEFRLPRKLLVIADPFGLPLSTFEGALREALGRRGVGLEFLPWQEGVGCAAMRGSLGAVVRGVQNSTADAALIVPSALDCEGGVPIRLQKRALAAVMEAVQSGRNIRSLTVGTGFPSLRCEATERLVGEAVGELAREYGVRILDVGGMLRDNPDWQLAYRRDPASNRLYEIHPVQASAELADRLAVALGAGQGPSR